MTPQTAVAATVVLVAAAISSGVCATLAPIAAVTHAQQRTDSRAELYRRNLLASGDVPCRTNASCAALGVAALEAGQLRQAQTMVRMEAALAEVTAMEADEDNSPKAASFARVRMAIALVHEGDVQQRLGALSDARAYYRTAVSRGDAYPDDALLGRIVDAARQRLEAISARALVQGLRPGSSHFAHYMFFGAWNNIDIKPVKGRRGVYRIDGDFIYPIVDAAGNPSANMGNLSAYVRFYDGVARVPMTDDAGAAPLDATAKIGNLAPYDGHADKCLIEFRLSAPETLDVATHGSGAQCGFGHNVSADGRYYLMTDS